MKKSKLTNQLYVSVVKHLKKTGLTLPLKNVTFAVSGGSDSVAMAHLMLNWPGNLVDKTTAKIIHINHHWREDSYLDEELVKKLANSMGVKFQAYHVKPIQLKNSSPESLAREQRKEIFSQYELVLTAHNANDVVETILWKTMQGKEYGVGIKIQHQNQLRPLLWCDKNLLQSYLLEQKVQWREDSTNHDGKLLRSKMRQKLMPMIKEIFPESQTQVLKNSLQAQYIKKS